MQTHAAKVMQMHVKSTTAPPSYTHFLPVILPPSPYLNGPTLWQYFYDCKCVCRVLKQYVLSSILHQKRAMLGARFKFFHFSYNGGYYCDL